MNRRRWVPAAVAAALAITLVPAASAAPADPDEGLTRVAEDRGPLLTGAEVAAERSAGRSGGTAAGKQSPTTLPGKPRNDVIEDVPVDPTDASIPLNLIPYHDFAPRLRALQASDRISVEVIGQSVQGRDLHLVVATSPMTDADWDEWQQLSDLRTDDPHAALAALEAGGYDDWKSPLFINNNIHGNEWEGTDATFQVLEELAFSDDEEVVELVEEHVLAFVVSMNPDGRVNGTRANANGFDMNRDFITQSQPETQVLRDQLIRYNPLTMLDQHGYVAFTLIEPTTGPHGDNYEYDLYIRNALRNALAMEQAVLATGEPNRIVGGGDGTFVNESRVRIPYRDNTTGWDDWPPIFTPMYAMYHGSVGHTVEFPHNPRGANLSVANRHERTRINTAISRATIESNFEWANENRMSVLADQLEIYRRGVDGEPLRPIDDPLALDLALGDNAETVEIDLPRAYVIPAGADQRSDASVARVVEFLVANDVEVSRTTATTRIAGATYPAGSYVVDMHQAKRGMANTILDIGRDVTDAYPTMYDISAWSLGSLWGADVVQVEEGSLPRQLVPVAAPSPTGSVPPGNRAAYVLSADDLAGVQAVNRLQADGAELSRLANGDFLVRADYPLVRAVASDLGVDLTAVPPGRLPAAEDFDVLSVGFSGPADELFSLRRMGFEVTVVNTAGFNAGSYGFDDFDALYVSSTALNPENFDSGVAAEFDAWLADGGNVVGRGGSGVTFNTRAGLLPVVAAAGRGDANGIVAVVNDPASPITGGALTEAFVDAPRYFTTVGDGVRVDQRLAEEGFFLAGHWIGQEAAAGQPVVVSGSARGADVTLFGTEPLYRTHPEGMFPQVAEALWLD
jgi:hypothetical protein